MKLSSLFAMMLASFSFVRASIYNGSKPAVVLIHGAWVSHSFWDITVNKLRGDGYKDIVIPDFVSSYVMDPPTSSHRDDVAIVQKSLRILSRAGKDIVVVMHSYGGLVGSDAIEGFVKSGPYGSGGGVVAAVYNAAFVVEPGKALSDYFGGSQPPFIVPDPNHPGYVQVDDPRTVFFNDFTDAEAARWLPSIRSAAAGTFTSTAQYAPWLDIPCTYILTTLDNAISPALQSSMVEAVQSKSHEKWGIYEVEAGHASAIIKADDVSRLIGVATGL